MLRLTAALKNPLRLIGSGVGLEARLIVAEVERVDLNVLCNAAELARPQRIEVSALHPASFAANRFELKVDG